MRDVNTALYEFWSGFGIPAYRQGRVPTGTEYPYITFEVSAGDAMSKTILVAHNWHKAPGATVAAAHILDMIATAIPHAGVILPVSNQGNLVLYRNKGDWQSYVQDADDADVIGGRTSYEIHFHLV